MNGTKTKMKFFRVWGSALTIIFMSACIAAIPLVINYTKSREQTVAKAEMPVPAEKGYRTALSVVEEMGEHIVNKEDDQLFAEATDGIQTAFLKIMVVSREKSELNVVATLTAEMEKEEKKKYEKELALRIIDRICERFNVKCTVKEK